MEKKAREHTRINDILLGPLERPALQFFARTAPAWMTPDTMTMIGVIGAIIIGTGYLLAGKNLAFLWLASAGYIINWYGDSMDGTLARYRKIERPKFGYYIDHMVDALVEFIVILALGFSSLVHFEIAAIALIGYLLLSIHTYLRTYVDDIFKISFGKLGPTEVRVLIIIINTAVFFSGNPQYTITENLTFSLYDLLMIVISLLIYGHLINAVIRTSLELSRLGE
jgi:phosphatidylglycerophosphate synthase